MFEDLCVHPVRAIKTDGDVGGVGSVGMRIQGLVGRPAVIRLPGVVRTLKQHLRAARVAHDEDNVTLPIRLMLRFGLRRKLAKIDADVIDIAAVREAGFIPSTVLRVRVIRSGVLDKPVSVLGLHVTAGAREVIEQSGGHIG